MRTYRAGTISLTNASPVIVGVGTLFLANISIGDIIISENGQCFEVVAVTDDTHLTVDSNAKETGSFSYASLRFVTAVNFRDLSLKIEQFLLDRQRTLSEFTEWSNGTITGGPNSDGYYPLTDRNGVTNLFACPAKLAYGYEASVDSAAAAAASAASVLDSEVAAAASAAAAEASKTSAATSETNALASKNAAATSATNAATSETNALASKNAAAASATAAAGSATSADSSKTAAAGSATSATSSATAAASSATSASTSAATATTKASEASTSATSAASSASAANTSKTAAAASETAAAASATAANTSKNNAATSATNASTSAGAAATSATNAATSETNAAASATAAAASATAANTSKNAAATSATAAAGSATAANASKVAAGTSEENALASKNAAATSETNANTSKNAAATSATAAAGSATAASGSATAASGSATNASNSAAAALTAQNKAQQWAENPENSAVETGKYSALHWAAKAAASAASTADKQPLNGRLTSIASLVMAVNEILISDSTTTMAKLATGAKGREILGAATDVDARSALALGSAALATMTTSTSDSTVGRVLQVGSLGLGGVQGVAVPNNNLDDCTVTGFYNIASNTTSVPVGATSGSVCFTQCFNGASAAHQLVFGYTYTNMWFRRRNSGTWSAWEQTTKESSFGAFGLTLRGLADAAAARAAIGVTYPFSSATSSAVDFNTLTAPGWQPLLYSASSPNAPTAAAGGNVVYWYVHVNNYQNSTTALQTAYPYGTGNNAKGRMAWRSLYQGVWTDWSYAAVTSELGTAAALNVTASQLDVVGNRLLKTGDFGLGTIAGAPIITTAALDLNTTASGFYRVDVSGAAFKGLPIGVYGVLIDRLNTGVACMQVAVSFDRPGKMYTRGSTSYDFCGHMQCDSLLNTTDLNTILESGVYGQHLNTNATAGSNYPVTQAGTLLVENSAGNIVTQTYTQFNTSRKYVRTYYSGVWQPWDEQITAIRSGVNNTAIANGPLTGGQTWTGNRFARWDSTAEDGPGFYAVGFDMGYAINRRMQIAIQTGNQMYFRYTDTPDANNNWKRALSDDDLSTTAKRSVIGLSDMAFSPNGSMAFVNLMNDSGRFGGKVDPFGYLTAGAFTVSGLLTAYNGGVWSEGGKFIHDNTTSGGTRGALNASAQALMTAIGRGPIGGNSRYGIEYYIGKYTCGAGTATGSTGLDGVVRYLTSINGTRALFSSASYSTFTCWLRVTSGSISSNFAFYVNGTLVPGGTVVTSASGWFHFRVVTQSLPGYNNAFPNIYAVANSVFEMAMPGFFAGFNDVGLHTSPLITMNDLATV